MKATTILVLAALLLVFATAPVFAGHHYHGCGYGGGMSWDMSDRDSNGDGVLSFDEFSAPQQESMRSGFDMIDSDKDGSISGDEWNTFLQVHGVSPKE